MAMKKDDSITKQTWMFKRRNKPNQQALRIYKSKINEEKRRPSSRLRTATKQKQTKKNQARRAGSKQQQKRKPTKNKQTRPAVCEQQSNNPTHHGAQRLPQEPPPNPLHNPPTKRIHHLPPLPLPLALTLPETLTKATSANLSRYVESGVVRGCRAGRG